MPSAKLLVELSSKEQSIRICLGALPSVLRTVLARLKDQPKSTIWCYIMISTVVVMSNGEVATDGER